jgi:hypothetical protein
MGGDGLERSCKTPGFDGEGMPTGMPEVNADDHVRAESAISRA